MLQDGHFWNYLFGVILNILKWSDGFDNIVKQYSIFAILLPSPSPIIWPKTATFKFGTRVT